VHNVAFGVPSNAPAVAHAVLELALVQEFIPSLFARIRPAYAVEQALLEVALVHLVEVPVVRNVMAVGLAVLGDPPS